MRWCGGWRSVSAWVQLALVACGPPTTGGQTLYKAFQCNRLNFPQDFYAKEGGLFNPAAVFHPQHGWIVVMRYDTCSVGASPNCTVFDWDSKPYIAKLGKQTFPEVEGSLPVISVDYTAQSWSRAKVEVETEKPVVGDLRPFVWGSSIFVGHWLYAPEGEPYDALGNRMVVQAISKLNVDTRKLVLTRVFKYIGRKRIAYGIEKNWGYTTEGRNLLLWYKLLPYTVVARLRDQQPGIPTVHAAWFLATEANAEILEKTGLDLASHVHNSGHPVPWVHADGRREYLAMVHQRVERMGAGYAHWAVRLDRRTKRPTHVSAGAVLKWADYRIQGFWETALVIGSFHILPDAGPTNDATVLRVFFGEGDRYSCWEDVELGSIVWHALNDTLLEKLEPMGGSGSFG